MKAPLALYYVTFQCGPRNIFRKIKKKIFAHKKLKKTPQKVAYLWQLGGFFSAAQTAQNSPELHFRFINFYIIQTSLLKSLRGRNWHHKLLLLRTESIEER